MKLPSMRFKILRKKANYSDFSFKDLNGILITNESMKGKIVVIKCWYIHCAACIKEFQRSII
jgi:cytochrome oxidase Cu insertion factor (SCO1/SenC/PrrC family)